MPVQTTELRIGSDDLWREVDRLRADNAALLKALRAYVDHDERRIAARYGKGNVPGCAYDRLTPARAAIADAERQPLPQAAARLREQYDRGNAAQEAAGWFGKPRALIEAIKAQQDAYVAYVAAYGRLYPAEAHLLPDSFRGRQLPEHAAFVAAAARVEAMGGR